MFASKATPGRCLLHGGRVADMTRAASSLVILCSLGWARAS
jgi:hypothetical protein